MNNDLLVPVRRRASAQTTALMGASPVETAYATSSTRRWSPGVVIGCLLVVALALLVLVQQQGTLASVPVLWGQAVVSVSSAQRLQSTPTLISSSRPTPTASVAVAPSSPYSVVGAPTLTAAFINRVLAAYHSPALGTGQALYDLGVQYGIDPAFALAFFFHESGFGTQGEARSSLSLGNLRCIPNFTCQDGYAWFPTWEAGFAAWYSLISNLYVKQWGLTTVSQIIPRYAPPTDNNNDAAYIAAVEQAIDTWHAGKVLV